MHDTVRSFRRPALLSLPALLLLVPAAALLLFVSHTGRSWLDRIAAHHEAVAVLPGLTAETLPLHGKGLVITSIRSDSQAASRGIAVGDSVVAIDGTPMFTLDQARRYLQKDKAETVNLRVVHGHQSRDVRLGRDARRELGRT